MMESWRKLGAIGKEWVSSGLLTLRTALCPLENGQLSMFNISLANKQCIKLSSNFTEWSRNFMKGEHLALFGDLHLYYLKIGKLPQTSIQIPTWGRRDDPRNQSVITHVLLSDFLRDSLFLVFFFWFWKPICHWNELCEFEQHCLQYIANLL